MSTHGKGIIERLHPDTPLRNNSNGGNKFIHNTIGEYLDNYVRRDLKKQLFILHATGKYLDIHGEERGVKRNQDESDDAYRERILLEKHMHNTIPELKARGVRFWDYVSGLGSGSQSFYFQLFDTDELNPIKNMKLQLAVIDLVTNEEKPYNFVTDKRGLAVVNITQPKHSYKLVLKTIDSSNTYEDLTLDFSMNNKYSSKNNTMLLANTQNIKRYDTLGFKLFADNGTILKDKNLKITVNGITYTKTTNDEGIANLTCKLDIGNYLLKVNFEDNEWYGGSNYASTLIVADTVSDFNPYATILVANDFNKYYKNATQYVVRLQDIYGNPISDMDVVICVNGVNYNRITNSSGEAKLNINLYPGMYYVSTSFGGCGNWTKSFVNSSVTVLSQIISHDLTKILRNGSQFIVKFVDNAGNPIEGKTIDISINGIVYSRITNSSGEAKLNINLNPGKYEVITSCGDFVNHNMVNVLSNIESDDLSMYYKDGSKFKVVIYDSEGKVKPNVTVKFTINGVSYVKTTDNDGIAALSINLNSNIYTITTEYNGIVNTNQIWIYNMAVNIGAVNETVERGKSFCVKLSDVNGNAIAGGQVSFKINGVSYIKQVNETGYAKLNINLNPGVYKIITAFSIRNYEDKLLYNTLKVTDTN